MTSLELSDGQISEFWECGYVAIPGHKGDPAMLRRRPTSSIAWVLSREALESLASLFPGAPIM
jgi:hypothetical protein